MLCTAKRLFLSLGLMMFLASGARADLPPELRADFDLAAFNQLQMLPRPDRQMSTLESMQWSEAVAQARRTAALAFLEKYPRDPRRWEVVLALRPNSPSFVTDWGPLNDKGVPANQKKDEAAAAAWKAKVEDLQAQAAKATDLTPVARRLLDEKTAPKPQIYDPKADAKKQIADAVAEAKRTGRHVMLQIGGQWCIWCLRLYQTIEADPQIKRALEENYVVVHLNYSTENKNDDVMAELGNPGRFGYPVLVILDGEGRRIHTQNSAYLEEGSFHSKAKLLRFFADWSPKGLKPQG